MPPYDPCWCGSGRKWKFCHKLREAEAPLARAVLQNFSFENAANRSICLHPFAPTGCSQTIAKAHTVQRNRSLAAIAEGGHVLSVKDGMKYSRTSDALKPKMVGVRQASTFRGFCQTHDHQLFRTIEVGEIEINETSAFQFGFRSLCYELFQKHSGLETMRFLRDNLDRGKNFLIQNQIQQEAHMAIHGFEAAISDFSIYKNRFDAYFKNEMNDRFNFYTEVFDTNLPIAISTAFNPEHGFSGQNLQNMNVPIGKLELLCLNLSAVNGKTYLNFGWFGEPDGPNARFVSEFAALPPNRKFDAILILAFEFTEHIFIRPSWWRELSQAQRNELIARCPNTPGSHSAECLDLGKANYSDVSPSQVHSNV